MSDIDHHGGLCDTAGAETVAPQQVCDERGVDLQLINQTLPQNLDTVEAAMLCAPQVDISVEHHFGPGVYIRSMIVPSNTYIMGHAHKHDHLNILIRGKMLVLADGTPKMIEGPYIFTSGPGRKFAFVVDECVFQNIYATDETDIDKLEEMLVDKSPAWEDAHAIEAAFNGYLEGVA